MTVCYFGIYDPSFSRNRVYIRGLREAGVEVLECTDRSHGVGKYMRLIQKHRAMKDQYDVLVVGYPGYTVVWLARFLTSKPIVFDALCTMHEAQVLSRAIYSPFSPRWLLTVVLDWLSVTLSNLVLVETEAQRSYFLSRFFLQKKKVQVLFTGADDTLFFPEEVPKRDTFTAIFRGRFLAEAGLPIIVEAAKLLEDKGVHVLIVGSGHTKRELDESVATWNPKNLTIESRHLSYDELRAVMRSCHVVLGQFASHERLSRTIPHKAFEALALNMPYVTAEAEGHKELLTHEKNCLLTPPGSAASLAEALIRLKHDPILFSCIAERGYGTFLETSTSKVLGRLFGEYLRVLVVQSPKP